jgi:hypothetical protein
MIYLIITTCIIPNENEKNESHRKTRYIQSIETVLKMVDEFNLNNSKNIKPIIVENNGKRDTYLDDFKCDVLYTKNNNIACKHKGVKELKDIKDAIKQYNIDDNDMIVKITGRYRLLNDNFFKIILENEQKYHAFLKFFNVCTLKFHHNFDDCILGLFAIRCKYLKKFTYHCMKSPEVEFAEFVKFSLSKPNIYSIKSLNLECCFADNLRLLIV